MIVVSSSSNKPTSSDGRRSRWKISFANLIFCQQSFKTKEKTSILSSSYIVIILIFRGSISINRWRSFRIFSCTRSIRKQRHNSFSFWFDCLNYRILSHLRTGPASVPLNMTVKITMTDVVVYINERASVETFRKASAKANAPRKPEKIIIACQRQLIGVLRNKFNMKDKNTTDNVRASGIMI